MPDPLVPKLSKWPFFAGDLLLLAAAFSIYNQNKIPPGAMQISVACLCVALGAAFAIVPFLLEYRVAARLAESSNLTTVVSQLEKLEKLAGQISGATGQWQAVQENADKTAGLAGQIAERMSYEAKSFAEFIKGANESEKAHLRLEVEKLHRSEKEWVQLVVLMLDHTFALHQGAVRSGRKDLISQLGSFQAACRDAARRVGLNAFTAQESEPFSPERHQLVEENGKVPADALIADTVATGYTYQGRMIRPAIVRLQDAGEVEAQAPEIEKSAAGTDQSQLPFETAQVE